MAEQPSLWYEHLNLADCWALLASSPAGRIGVLVDGAPEIYPVNHVVDGRTIVFRTDPGNKLRGLDRNPSVCFEVDSTDPEHRTGWSVLIKGRAHEITERDELDRASTLPLHFWTLGDKAHWVQIEAQEITGRRIHRGLST